MLVTFLDSREIVHEEFVPLGRSPNEGFHAEVLSRLFKEFIRKTSVSGKRKLAPFV
jgi:hypothetical protein